MDWNASKNNLLNIKKDMMQHPFKTIAILSILILAGVGSIATVAYITNFVTSHMTTPQTPYTQGVKLSGVSNLAPVDVLPELIVTDELTSSKDDDSSYKIYIFFPLLIRNSIHDFDFQPYLKVNPRSNLICQTKDIGTPDGSSATSTLYFEGNCRGSFITNNHNHFKTSL